MIRSILKLAAFGVAVFLIASLLAPSALTQREIYRKAAAQTFRVLNPDNIRSGGTGFVVQARSGKPYLVTNAHVCNVSEREHMVLEHQSRPGRYMRTPIIEISAIADLCVLIAPDGYKGLNIANDVYLMQQVYAVGHPRLGPIAITAGWVRARETVPISYCRRNQGSRAKYFPAPMVNESFEELLAGMDCIKEMDSYVTNASIQPGSSGSAALNDDGEVVGVMFAGDPYDSSLMVPLEYVKQFLAAY